MAIRAARYTAYRRMEGINQGSSAITWRTTWASDQVTSSRLEKLKETAQTEAEFKEVNNFEHVLQEVTADKILKKYKAQHSEQLTGEKLKGANAIFDVITGKTIRFYQYWEEHLQELKVEPKTKDAKFLGLQIE